ncbi:LOW QUALITY PROTEIN: semaphorin-4E-like [Chlamydotis macqueenii]
MSLTSVEVEAHKCVYLCVAVYTENSVRKCLFALGNNVHLTCVPLWNLASVVWECNGCRLQAEDSKYLLCDGGIAVFKVAMDAAGFYDCLSVERSKGKDFVVTVARSALHAQGKTEEANVLATANEHNEAEAEGFQLSVPLSLLSEAANQRSVDSQRERLVLKLFGAGFDLFFLSAWNYKSHLSLPWKSRETSSKSTGTTGLGSPALATEPSGSDRRSSATQMNVSAVNGSMLASLS